MKYKSSNAILSALYTLQEAQLSQRDCAMLRMFC